MPPIRNLPLGQLPGLRGGMSELQAFVLEVGLHDASTKSSAETQNKNLKQYQLNV